jgi:hypothetical protein
MHDFSCGSGEGYIFGFAWAKGNVVILGTGVGSEGCIIGGADGYGVGRLRATVGLDGVCRVRGAYDRDAIGEVDWVRRECGAYVGATLEVSEDVGLFVDIEGGGVGVLGAKESDFLFDVMTDREEKDQTAVDALELFCVGR